MEKAYWLGRERVSLKAAQDSVSAETRLTHYDLAGRYSVKARSVETRTTIGVGDSSPRDGAADGHTKDASHA